MKISRLVINRQPPHTTWHMSKVRAEHYLRSLQKNAEGGAMPEGTIIEVEIPTKKEELVAWLNTHTVDTVTTKPGLVTVLMFLA